MNNNELISNAFFRMVILARVLELDAGWLLPQCNDSGIKNALSRLKNGATSNIETIKSKYKGESKDAITAALSEDKIASIHNILSRLVMMSDSELETMEDDILEVTKLKGSTNSVTEVKEGV